MDRVAIVTGASRGIGRATAIRLARDFGAVALVARTRDTLARTADAAGAVVTAAREALGRIDALACIAGVVPQADMFAFTDGRWDDDLALKFHSARRLTIAAWEALGGRAAPSRSRRARRPTRPRLPLPPSA